MKLNLKKAIPILTSALLVGSSFAAAAISSVDQWKSFGTDTAIVFGSDGAAVDSAAAGILGMALQAALTGVSAEPTIQGEVIKLEKSGNKYNLNEDMNNIWTGSLDGSDLPTLLADGKYEDSEGTNKNKVTYTQTLTLGNNGVLKFDQDDDLAPNAGVYLIFDSGVNVFEYALEFDDVVEYDNSGSTDAYDDLVPTTLKFQGKTFTITDVKLNTSGALKEITMQSGETAVWLMEANPITWRSGGKEYKVELVDVTEAEDSCGIKVNDGSVVWIDVGETKNVGGLDVGVIDAKAVHQQTQTNDACQVNLGAIEFKISEGKEIEVNGVKIDGSSGDILETTAGQWEGFKYSWAPEDDTYLPAKDGTTEIVDPVFGGFKIKYNGHVVKTEEIKVDISGSKGKISWKNEDGKVIELPITCQGGCDNAADKVWFASKDIDEDNGGDIDVGEKIKYLVQVGGSTDYVTLAGGNIPAVDLEGLRFLLVSGGETHLFKIEDIDISNGATYQGKITITDETAGGTKTYNYITGLNNVELPHGFTVPMTISDDDAGSLTAFAIDLSGNGNPETELGATIDLASYLTANAGFEIANIGNGILKITEDDDYDGDPPYVNPAEITITASIDTTDKELDLNSPTITANTYYGWVDESDTNDDNRHAMTYYGTKIIYDQENNKKVTVLHPDEELYGEVYLAETPAVITAPVAKTGGVLGDVIFSDDELTSELKAKNLIIIGGTAVNRVAAEALDLPYPTYGSSEAWQTATGVTGEG
ncbi:MAG: hypothetical protein QXJ92_00150, partial [Candidatus Pacearchaeota archaeon]